MSIFRECGDEIEKQIRPKTVPFVVKMLKKKEDIPKKAMRPKRDFGRLLDVCQAFALARRDGLEVALLKEDIWCPEPVIGYGFAEPPKWFLEGHMWFPWAYETLEAGANLAASLPRFKSGQYVGIVSAPYKVADFEPDLLIVYGNASQMKRLIDGARYRDGYGIGACLHGRCAAFGNGACVRAVVPAIQTGRSQITLPCGGDHKYAIAQDDELIFTVPKKEMEDLIKGLKRTAELGISTYPYKFTMMLEHELHDTYLELRKILEMTERLGETPKEESWYRGSYKRKKRTE